MAQPHPTPQKHNSPDANPNVTTQKPVDLTKRCACAVKSSSTLQHLTNPHDSSLFHTNLTRRVSIRAPFQKLLPMAAPYSALPRTVANAETNPSQTRLYPQTPRIKREPFATHSGKRCSTRAPPSTVKAYTYVYLLFIYIHICVHARVKMHQLALPNCVFGTRAK